MESSSQLASVEETEGISNVGRRSGEKGDGRADVSMINVIPLGLGRWTLLALYLTIGFLTGSFIFNWPPTQQLYVHSGAYHWLCSSALLPPPLPASSSPIYLPSKGDLSQEGGEEAGVAVSDDSHDSQQQASLFRGLYRQTWPKTPPSLPTDSSGGGGNLSNNPAPTTHLRRRGHVHDIQTEATKSPSAAEARAASSRLLYYDPSYGVNICTSQLQAIDALMPACVASMFVFALIGGLTVDFIGPKVAATLGLVCQISGWALLGFCNERLPLYLLSNMLIGFGNDPMYLALLNAINLFPRRRGVVLSVLSASRALSFLLPSTFDHFLVVANGQGFRFLCLLYVGVQVLCLAVVLTVFPMRPFVLPPTTKQESEALSIESKSRSADSEKVPDKRPPLINVGKPGACTVPSKPLLRSSFQNLRTPLCVLPPAAAAACLTSAPHQATKIGSLQSPVVTGGDGSAVAADEHSFLSAASTVSTLYSLSKGFHPSRVIPPSAMFASPTRCCDQPGGILGNSSSLPLGASSSWIPPSGILLSSQHGGIGRLDDSRGPIDTESSIRGKIMRFVSLGKATVKRFCKRDGTGDCTCLCTPDTSGTKTTGAFDWIDVLPLLPIAATTILSATFFAVSAKNQLGATLAGDKLVNALTLSTPLAFLPAILFGHLADSRSPFAVLLMMNALACLQYLLLTSIGIFSQYAGETISRGIFLAACGVVGVNFILSSFTLAQFSCYVALSFPTSVFGTLTGAVVMTSGLFSLVVTPMCDFSSFALNYTPMNALCLGLTAGNWAFLYVLYRARERSRQKREMTKEVVLSAPDEVKTTCHTEKAAPRPQATTGEGGNSSLLSTTITEVSLSPLREDERPAQST